MVSDAPCRETAWPSILRSIISPSLLQYLVHLLSPKILYLDAQQQPAIICTIDLRHLPHCSGRAQCDKLIIFGDLAVSRDLSFSLGHRCS